MSKSSSVFLPPEQTRLVTICAHVDHGKTTLADNLIESNGIISERLAGTIRYLDSLEEEQRRGITMRASAIGLRHQYTPPPNAKKKQRGGGDPASSSSLSSTTPIIVHLLDSPGHTDFSAEVSSSLQCCDGCLLVVDAVEGMCARTHQVVREAHSHQLVPILVINKVDRLCTNLCLTPTEAYLRLRLLIESVNAACAAMLVSKQAEQGATKAPRYDVKDQNKQLNNDNDNDDETKNRQQTQEEEEDARWTFEPHRGNVIFASALYGWGFTVPSLARSLFRNKVLTIKPVVLKQYLFGDFCFKQQQPSNDDDKDKLVKWKGGDQQQQPPLFAEYCLQPIWDIYESVASAAVACGLGSSLFADGRISAIPSMDFHNKSDNGNDKKPQKQSSDKAKIQATSPGMDQVLQAMQIGNTAPSNASRVIIDTVEAMQQVLTRTGSSSSEEAVLRCLLRRFRPLSDIVLNAAYEICPSPVQAASHVRPRALALASPEWEQNETTENNEGGNDGNHFEEFKRIKQAVHSCDISSTACTVAYVCKFLAADRSQIRDPSSNGSTNNNAKGYNDDASSSVILGLARVLSGRLKTGNSYHVMGHKHKFNDATTSIPSRPIRLYLLMGSSFVLVNEVPAGHLCAILNLENVQYKTATLCDSPYGMPLRGFADMGIRPLVKVNVESVDPADTSILEKGLVKLGMADAAVEVTATAKGERILACLGELHLEQSILDLQKVYCDKKDIQLRISEPIVEFGETTAWFGDNELDFQGFLSDKSKKTPPLRQLTIPPYNEEEGIDFADRGRARSIVSGRVGAISLRVTPLDSLIFESVKHGKCAEGSEDSFEQLKRALGFPNELETDAVLKALRESVISSDDSGNLIVSTSTLDSGMTVAGVLSERDEIYVPRKLQTNPEENDAEQPGNSGFQEYGSVQKEIRENGFLCSNQDDEELSPRDKTALDIWKNQIKGSVVAGFQMAMRAGPICEEPVRRVLIILEGLEIALRENPGSDNAFKTASPLSGGMVAATIRIGIRSALLSRPARLVESHLKLTLNSSLAGLGPLYTVLSKRRGKVLEDSMVEGTDLLLISASLPHAESFGLAPELFRLSSGEVTAPELIFSHWEILDQDPFWIPTSLEEREDFGEILQSGDVSTGIDNTALTYIRKVRARKGLLVDSSRTVVAAEKQRTIKR